ncbi:MAG: hypothetical protein PHW17_13385, partial [Desulfobacterales bacterium]|nr:hypothetical protein [Desulfobacterales bacterium]
SRMDRAKTNPNTKQKTRSCVADQLREAQVPYDVDFTPENSGLRAKNAYFCRDNPEISIR